MSDNDERKGGPGRNGGAGRGQGGRGSADAGRGDNRPPRRDGDSRPPRRDGDSRPPRRDGDSRPPRRDGDSRPPRREGDSRPPRRDGDSRPPRRAGDSRPPRRDGDSRPPRRESDSRPPRRDGDSRPPRREGSDTSVPRRDRDSEDRRGRNHFNPDGDRRPRRDDRKDDRPKSNRRHPEVSVRSGGRQTTGVKDTMHWIYGRHAVLAAMANPRREIQRLIATPQVLENTALGNHGLLETMSRSDMDAVLSRYDRDGATHGGIAAYAAPLAVPSAESLLKPEGKSVVVVLDQVSDPHNVGAIMRSAAAFGARAVMAPERNAAPITGALAKSASGALESVPYLRPTNLARALAMLKEWGYWRIGLDGDAEAGLAEASKFDRIALVMGAEGKGLRRLTAENCDLLVSIPMSGAIESLNVSNAAAIALYELSRS